MISKDYKNVLFFLFKFLGLYVVLNVVYGLFIEFYHPGYDPFTGFVTKNVVYFLHAADPSVSMLEISGNPSIKIMKEAKTVISVFEGCNSLNVIIVYVAFLFAFEGSIKNTIQYGLVGISIIYVINLIRVILLYEVALYFPQNLYFFHKYFFTGMIYAVVFVLWYFWIKRVSSESGTSAPKS